MSTTTLVLLTALALASAHPVQVVRFGTGFWTPSDCPANANCTYGYGYNPTSGKRLDVMFVSGSGADLSVTNCADMVIYDNNVTVTNTNKTGCGYTLSVYGGSVTKEWCNAFSAWLTNAAQLSGSTWNVSSCVEQPKGIVTVAMDNVPAYSIGPLFTSLMNSRTTPCNVNFILSESGSRKIISVGKSGC